MSEETGETKPENISETINTDGGAYVAKSVHTAGGDFIGRDYNQTIVHGVPIEDIEHLPPEAGGPPYQGLRYFEEKDADWFFGRERVTAVLVNRLHETNFLAVVGDSGSGKSSVVRAGVIPAMKGNKPLSDGSVPPLGDWQVKVMTPTARPLDKLVVTLLPDDKARQAAMYGRLSNGPNALRNALTGMVTGERPLLLVVDQFEELFSQCKDELQRETFIANLVAAAQPACKIILTLRPDFYASCLRYESLRRILKEGQEPLGPMNREELRAAILGPAAKGGWKVQEGLAEAMLDDVGQEPGALPLLSHALRETWERRRGRVMTLSGYRASGGVKGAIAQTAETVYQRLTPDEQALAQQIFLRLTELGEGTQDTGRRLRRAELRDDPLTAELTKKLADARLITTTENGMEVAHEALIREWPRLREWLDSDREGLIIHRRLTHAANEWHEKGEDNSYLHRGSRLVQAREWAMGNQAALNALEQRFLTVSQMAEATEQRQRANMVRRALIGVSIFLVLAIAAAIFGFVQSGIATDNANLSATREIEARIAQEEAVAAQQTTEAESNARATQEAVAVENANLAATRAVESSNAQATAAFNAKLATDREAEAVTQAQIAQSQALAAASLAVREKDPMRGLLLAIAAGQTEATALTYDTLHGAISRLALPRHTLLHDGGVNGSVWNKNDNLILTWNMDDTARVWDATNGEERLRLSHDGWGYIYGAAWNGEESLILTWSTDGTARVWDATSGKERLRLSHDTWVYGAAWNGDESLILTWSGDNTARLWDAASGQERLRLSHDAGFYGAAWNGDESLILTWSRDGTAWVWDAASGEVRLRLSHDDWVYGAAWNGDESLILTWSGDNTARLWDAASGEERLRLRHDGGAGGVNGAVWNGDESLILTWSGGVARLWDAASGEERLRLRHGNTVRGAVWNGDESLILTWSRDDTARVWDAASGQERLRLNHDHTVNGATWNRDESLILTWSDDLTARVWDATSGTEQRRLSRDDEWLRFSRGDSLFGVTGAAWNGDESLILTWSMDGMAQLWDATSAAKPLHLSHFNSVTGAAWNGDESLILTFSEDSTARLWDAASGEERLRLRHDNSVSGAVWNGDESLILTWSNDLTMRLWDATSGEERLRLSYDVWDYIYGAAWNGDESLILTWSRDNTVQVWDTASGTERLRLSHESSVWGAAWNGDESLILTWGVDSTARVWDAASGEERLHLSHYNSVRGAVWNGDESLILTWSDDGAARVWGAASGEKRLYLNHDHMVNGAAWNGDESLILTWSDDLTARVWDAASGEERLRLSHESGVLGAAWNGDESLILTWSRDNTTRIWDTATGAILFTLNPDGTPVVAAQWSQDGRLILLVTKGGFVGSLAVQMADWVNAACQRTIRNFTWTEWQLYFPGQPYRVICDQWPVHDSVPEGERP